MFKGRFSADEQNLNEGLRVASDAVPYNRNRARCLLQRHKPDGPPSPAPRTAAVPRKASVSPETLAFPLVRPGASFQPASESSKHSLCNDEGPMNAVVDPAGPRLAVLQSNPAPEGARAGYFTTPDKVRMSSSSANHCPLDDRPLPPDRVKSAVRERVCIRRFLSQEFPHWKDRVRSSGVTGRHASPACGW